MGGKGLIDRRDFYALGVAGILCAVISWACSEAVFSSVITLNQTDPSSEQEPRPYSELIRQGNIWFDGDPLIVYSQMTELWSGAHALRGQRHPLFSLFTTPLVIAIHDLTHVPFSIIIRVLLAIWAAAGGSLFFLICRQITGRLLEASVWTLLFASSSGFVFWSGIPESFPFGMVTILLPFAMLAYLSRLRHSEMQFTLATFLSLVVTVTNVMSGFICTLLAFRPKQSLGIFKTVVCLVVYGLFLQAFLLPQTQRVNWLQLNVSKQLRWVNAPESGGAFMKARDVLVCGQLIPDVAQRAVPITADNVMAGLTVQAEPFT